MLQLFKPNVPGALVAVILTVATCLGVPTMVESLESGDLKVSPLLFPWLTAIWSFPMALFGALRRWSRWSDPRAPVVAWVVLVPVLSLAGGVAFSSRYWGYAWSLPALDSRVHATSWVGIAPVAKDRGSEAWTRLDRAELGAFRVDAAPDDECCQTGRVVGMLEAKGALAGLKDLSAEEIERLQRVVFSLATFDRGEEGYDGLAYQRGVLLVGTLEGIGPVAFAVIGGAQVSNDHYPMDEILIALERPQARLLSHQRYYGDIAGVEGLTAGWMALILFILGAFLSPVVLLLISAFESVAWAWRPRRSPGAGAPQ